VSGRPAFVNDEVAERREPPTRVELIEELVEVFGLEESDLSNSGEGLVYTGYRKVLERAEEAGMR